MNTTTKQEIKDLVINQIEKKLEKYEAETDYRLFYEAILEKETIIKASLLQSLYTSFGMSIYEQIAIILSRSAGYHAERQYELLGSIDQETILLIEEFCSKPIGTCSKEYEIEQIRKIIRPGIAAEDPDRTVDVYLRKGDEEIFIDITSVKPNKKEARTLRRKLLRWVALRLSQDSSAYVYTYIGIPYNPYFPDVYSRSFVRSNMHEDEVLVQNDLWELFSGYDVFDELISVFDEVGEITKRRISRFISDRSGSYRV